MKFTTVIAAAAGLASVASGHEETNSHTPLAFEAAFESWSDEYGMEFNDSVEYLKRLAIFAENLKKIEEHNAGDHTFSMKMNQFGHMTSDEFKKNMTQGFLPLGGKSLRANTNSSHFVWKGRKDALPQSVNWVDQGAVTSVKNQGVCGSCWTFSSTGALEGAYFLKSGNLVNLSQQYILSCDTGGSGCSGGQMDQAFAWVQSQGGICAASDYPYTDANTHTASQCRQECTPISGTAPTSKTDVEQTEASLMAAVAKQPVSIAIEADQSSFQFYSGGVMTQPCGTQLDHGVLLVGYGSEEGQDYWLVKNSWGTTYGEAGYIKIQRGKNQQGGQCGILLSASYPTL